MKFWKEARRLDAYQLEKCTGKFIAANFDLLLEEKDFMNLDDADFKDVILLKSLNVRILITFQIYPFQVIAIIALWVFTLKS